MSYSWALEFPEVYKVCRAFEMIEVSESLRYCYKSLKEFLQDGPQCGLVALTMCLEKSDKEMLQIVYDRAKNLNYTCNGEMFSVNNMASLAKYFLQDSATVEVFSGDLNDTKIKKMLLDGVIILVPYDTNKDNSPGMHKGHKAHWAVISGGILTNDDFFVVARHGKARNVGIWKLNVLSESNKQLFEFSPDRKLQNIEYKLPDGGISGPLGLNNKCVLIKYS